MIKSLRIKNFRSYSDTFIEFSKGINVIIGDPNTGKSNIIKAVKLLRSNRPQGIKYYPKKLISAEPCEIEMGFIDGYKVKLIKEVKYNKKQKKIELVFTIYELYNQNELINSWKTGQEVPDEIVRILNINDVNIQNQSAQPFLLSSNSGQVTKKINAITKLEPVDLFLSELTSKVNKYDSSVKKIKEDITKLELKELVYSNINRVEGLVDKLNCLDKKGKELFSNVQKLDFLIEKFHIVDQYNRKTKECLEQVNPSLKKIEILKEEYNKNIIIKELIDRFLEVSKFEFKINFDEIKSYESILKKEDESRNCLGLINEYLKLFKFESSIEFDEVKNYEDLIRKENELKSCLGLINEYFLINNKINDLQKKKNNSRNNYEVKLREGKKCPVCFEKINDLVIDRIMKEL